MSAPTKRDPTKTQTAKIVINKQCVWPEYPVLDEKEVRLRDLIGSDHVSFVTEEDDFSIQSPSQLLYSARARTCNQEVEVKREPNNYEIINNTPILVKPGAVYVNKDSEYPKLLYQKSSFNYKTALKIAMKF